MRQGSKAEIVLRLLVAATLVVDAVVHFRHTHRGDPGVGTATCSISNRLSPLLWRRMWSSAGADRRILPPYS